MCHSLTLPCRVAGDTAVILHAQREALALGHRIQLGDGGSTMYRSQEHCLFLMNCFCDHLIVLTAWSTIVGSQLFSELDELAVPTLSGSLLPPAVQMQSCRWQKIFDNSCVILSTTLSFLAA